VKTVSRISIAPVKGMALLHSGEVRLERHGVSTNRRFHVIDETGRRYGQLRNGTLVRIVPEYDEDADRLTLRFPDGTAVSGEVTLGQPVATDFYGRSVAGHVVEGPWARAISAYAGQKLRLVKTEEPGAGVDRARGTVSLLGDESLAELARQSGSDEVDGRRFRMLIGIKGAQPHEEEEWLGRRVRVGEAVVALNEIVARCAITTQSPETGIPDFDTLREIKSYRGARNGKYIDFGVAGSVERPGLVRVGDPVEPE
jgi:uncharacterized protein YcbX